MSETDNELKNDNISTTDTSDRDSGASVDRHDHGDSDRSSSLRETIRDSWKAQTGEDPLPDEKRPEEKRERERRGERPGRSAREAKRAAEADAQRQADANNKTTDAAAQSQSRSAFGPDGAPLAWNAQAKQRWSELPKEVRDAVQKRETDVARGVAELKSRTEKMDAVMQPHMNVMRQWGHEPHQAVQQMWNWFHSLGENANAAFPALVKSYNHDPRQIVMSIVNAFPQYFPGEVQQEAQAAQHRLQTGQPAPQGQQQDAWRQGVEQELLQQRAYLQQQYQQAQAQQQAQVQDTLDRWAADKEFFNEPGLRQRMGILLQPDANGNSIVPLKNGAVDLDESYRLACLTMPAVAAKMDAQRQAAERRAAKEQADRARRAGMSFGPSSPGRNSGSSSNAKAQRRGVRESIESAIEEARGGWRI